MADRQRNPRLLLDAFVVESGASPWQPTPRSRELVRYRMSPDMPLVGVVEQDGMSYLYQCVLGQTEEVNIWLYTPLLPCEQAAIDASSPRKANELFARFSRRDGRLAIAHNSVGVIAVRHLRADGDPDLEVGVLFSALRDYLRDLRRHVQRLRRGWAEPRLLTA
ncbi:MAG TPA: hypothetical protein VMK16_11480 [Acidimicrobiales bacterium]|nr:hypothetical protein [Acidimicrobiales bacterium]